MKLSQLLIAAGAASFIAFFANPASAQMQTCMVGGAKQPVCATKGKTKQTYASSGCAMMDGAKVASQGACKAAKKGKKAAKKSSKKTAAKKK